MKRRHRQSLHLNDVEAAIVSRAAGKRTLATPDYARMATVMVAVQELGEEEVQRIQQAVGPVPSVGGGV